jgi:glycine/D-amino acid oxidase-like deaminating enzyme
MGPWSGKLVAEAALGGEWAEELEAFSVARFGAAPRTGDRELDPV